MNGRTKASFVLMILFSAAGLFCDAMGISLVVNLYAERTASNLGEAVGLAFVALFEVIFILMMVGGSVLAHGISCLVYGINRKHLTEGGPKRALFIICMVGLGIMATELVLVIAWIISGSISSGSSGEAQTATETMARMMFLLSGTLVQKHPAGRKSAGRGRIVLGANYK